MGKSLLASKTVWLNGITFLLVVLALPEFISLLPEEAIRYFALLSAVLNVLVRLITYKPITSVLPNSTTSGS